MIFTHLVRVLRLAVILFIMSLQTVSAHSLPGSELIFSQQGDQLNLQVSFPVEDLVIAEKTFQPLMLQAKERPLSELEQNALAAYFRQHLEVKEPVLGQSGKPIPLTLQKAELQEAYHHDLGHYVLVVSYLTATLGADKKLLPAILRYDAVMHEIRSHRANVYWQQGDGKLEKLTSFRFKRRNSQTVSHRLQ